jgi:hypothetical protein
MRPSTGYHRGCGLITSGALASPRRGVRRRRQVARRLMESCVVDLVAYRRGLAADVSVLAGDAVAVALALVVILSQLVDAGSTMLALTNNWTEANPLSAAVIARWGVPGLLAEKLMIASAVLLNMARLRGRSARALGAIAAVIGLGAAVWNLSLLGW